MKLNKLYYEISVKKNLETTLFSSHQKIKRNERKKKSNKNTIHWSGTEKRSIMDKIL